MNSRAGASRLVQGRGAISLLVTSLVFLPGCYGTKTLRQPITVEEIASDVSEIRRGQQQLGEDVQAMEAQLGSQAEIIRTLQAENQYLYQELDDRLAAIDAKLADVLGRDTGFSGSDPYWSGSARNEPAVPDWSGAAGSDGNSGNAADRSGMGQPTTGQTMTDAPAPATADTRTNLGQSVDTRNEPPSALDREHVADASTNADGQSKRVYDQAYLDLTRGNYSLAILGFKEFLRRVPESDISDNAQYWIGESYYMQGDFRQAVREYGKVIDAHAGGDRVASALYKLGLSKLQLGDRPEAIDYLRQVYERYPDSEEARLSRDKLDTLN